MSEVSSVKTSTRGNRWQPDSRCCWCVCGLNRTWIGDHVNNELSDSPCWESNRFVSVLPHRSKAYSQCLCSTHENDLVIFALFVSLYCVVFYPFSTALGQIMLYVDGMNGVIRHAETIQWLYTLVGSKVEFSVLQNSKKTPLWTKLATHC